ncbi:TIGR02996 domain-containing protein [Gemmata sp. JC673]|uniref:TIGR02996 domain-containing protein n=1 Tax=Gemmata algarum TaxID=2975278 RepID=A0ABU5F5C4_9BACT|nr:TIGR02996 domain-containing protein [Gemmata algarum]MDY3562002.1 TIGR02996 domain-containing protein [Gemmata algarum]
MSEEAALLRAIYAEPDDDTPRLVYADWLDENGQPGRAEFVRTQIELANRNDHTSDEYQKLNERANLLLEEHWGQWTEQFTAFSDAIRDERVAISFLRGLPESLSIMGATVKDFEIIRRLPNLRHLEIMSSPLAPAVLREIASLANLDELTTEATGFEVAWLTHLEPLPCWTHVRILEDLNARAWGAFQERRISKVTLLPPEQQRSAAIRYLRATRLNDSVRQGEPVKAVRLVQEATTDAELRLLSYLPELEEIEIAYGRETATGLEHLAGLPNLRAIHLGRANTESLVPLMKCKALERLEYIANGFSELRDEGVIGLEQLTHLQHLTLAGGRLGEATLRRVSALRELRTLDLDLGTLDDETALVGLGTLPNLQSLTLNGREYTRGEFQEFAAQVLKRADALSKPTYGLLE